MCVYNITMKTNTMIMAAVVMMILMLMLSKPKQHQQQADSYWLRKHWEDREGYKQTKANNGDYNVKQKAVLRDLKHKLAIYSDMDAHPWHPWMNNKPPDMIDNRGPNKKAGGKCCANKFFAGPFSELNEWSCDSNEGYEGDMRGSCPHSWSYAANECGTGRGKCH